MNKYENTTHKVIVGDTRFKHLDKESVNLIVTSPPYPMISMWDEMFVGMNSKIDLSRPKESFNLMNLEMKKVYQEMYNALKVGGVMIINIGDATRKVNDVFKLYPNAAKTIMMCEDLGFDTLPQIHWWKPTNSPNKFMGSGMYPVGAYVTLENEHILIFRKGIRKYSEKERLERQKSAFFQNERNLWFTDIWKDVYGARQSVKGLNRDRNAAFPFELAYRLINMFSIKGDIVVDPFGGTGTTTIAAMVAGRNSYLFDIEESFINYSIERISKIKVEDLNNIIDDRYNKAIREATDKYQVKGKEVKYRLTNGDPVYTRQELKIILPRIKKINVDNLTITCEYD